LFHRPVAKPIVQTIEQPVEPWITPVTSLITEKIGVTLHTYDIDNNKVLIWLGLTAIDRAC
jgi:hypothetical protein